MVMGAVTGMHPLSFVLLFRQEGNCKHLSCDGLFKAQHKWTEPAFWVKGSTFLNYFTVFHVSKCWIRTFFFSMSSKMFMESVEMKEHRAHEHRRSLFSELK